MVIKKPVEAPNSERTRPFTYTWAEALRLWRSSCQHRPPEELLLAMLGGIAPMPINIGGLCVRPSRRVIPGRDFDLFLDGRYNGKAGKLNRPHTALAGYVNLWQRYRRQGTRAGFSRTAKGLVMRELLDEARALLYGAREAEQEAGLQALLSRMKKWMDESSKR